MMKRKIISLRDTFYKFLGLNDMAYNMEFYNKSFSDFNEDDILNEFQKNLVKTNRDHKFFVDWDKIKVNAEKYKYELNLLNALIGSESFKEDLSNLLKTYPEVVRSFPILIAMRDLTLPIIEDFSQEEINISEYSFNVKRGSSLSATQIENYLSFVEKTGLKTLFYLIKDFYDYIVGVEVGMDTNARKNRGGKAMELLVEPLIKALSKKHGLKYYSQKKFEFIKKNHGINIPEGLKSRTCDFILIKGTTFLAIEVNYYSSSGSKPEEIVDSYINRFREINEAKGSFIWITDGNVWKTSVNQIDKGFRNLPYLLNIHFIRKGLLENAIIEIFSEADKSTLNGFF